jgi:hypothetical protein
MDLGNREEYKQMLELLINQVNFSGDCNKIIL